MTAASRNWLVGLLRDRHIEVPRLRAEVKRLQREWDTLNGLRLDERESVYRMQRLLTQWLEVSGDYATLHSSDLATATYEELAAFAEREEGDGDGS